MLCEPRLLPAPVPIPSMTAEASNPAHPARDFIRRRYTNSLADFVEHLTEARTLGEIGPLTDAQIWVEARLMFAVMDGLELQWLLDPAVDLVGLFNDYLEASISRWQAGLDA